MSPGRAVGGVLPLLKVHGLLRSSNFRPIAANCIDATAAGTVASPHARVRERRGLPAPGSIPYTLDIFRSEVRFYREVAAEAGVRVPACYTAEISDAGTLLVLEDLSSWRAGRRT